MYLIYIFINMENCMREYVNEWVVGMNINRYMVILYYIILGFFIMIVMLRYNFCSVVKVIIVIFFWVFDVVKKKG